MAHPKPSELDKLRESLFTHLMVAFYRGGPHKPTVEKADKLARELMAMREGEPCHGLTGPAATLCGTLRSGGEVVVVRDRRADPTANLPGTEAEHAVRVEEAL